MVRKLPLIATTLLLGACTGTGGWGFGRQSTIQPESETGRIVQDVYALVTWIGLGIFLVVAGLLIYALVRYRAGRQASDVIPAQVHGNVALELIWTVIPAVLLIFIAVPTWSAIFQAANPPQEGAITVRAIGHQWWWEFDYPGQGVVTANEMYVPLGSPIIVNTNSADVIHSFWVPRLAGKIDSLPGKVNTVWFVPDKTGMYWGQCAEFCGTSHANMRLRVHVVTPEEFDIWVAKQKQAPLAETDAARDGEKLFLQKGCIACHTISGVPVAVSKIGPDLTNLTARQTLASGIIDNTPENLVRWIRHTQDVKPSALMGLKGEDGQYHPIPMTDEEAGKIAAWLLSAPGETMAAAAPTALPAAAAMGATGGPTAEQLIMSKTCFACHVVPGVPAAAGVVGPSLAGLADRDKFAAGTIDNTPANLRKWLANPGAMKPGTTMPMLGLNDQELDTLVKFLSQLR